MSEFIWVIKNLLKIKDRAKYFVVYGYKNIICDRIGIDECDSVVDFIMGRYVVVDLYNPEEKIFDRYKIHAMGKLAYRNSNR